MNELDMEETAVDEEMELRLNEVKACERRLARQQERLVELPKDVLAWRIYELKAQFEEANGRESDGTGSSPGSDSDSDSDTNSDEKLTLNEMMERAALSKASGPYPWFTQ